MSLLLFFAGVGGSSPPVTGTDFGVGGPLRKGRRRRPYELFPDDEDEAFLLILASLEDEKS